MTIRIEDLSKHSYQRPVLDRLSLEVHEGEMLALVGSEGSGRASLLRLIAGLDQPDSGRILLDGTDLGRLPPRRRRIGALFQHDPLFGHATVAEAVGAAVQTDPDAAPLEAAVVAARVSRLLDLVGLAGEAGASPTTLPPQKRHRLSIARALAPAPRVLLIGQAAPGRDFGERTLPRRWLRQLHDRLGLTSIIIAQDVEEAVAIATRVAVLKDGRLEQVGRPAELQRCPATSLVADLFGGAISPQPATQWAFDLPSLSRVTTPPDALEVVDISDGSLARVVDSRLDGNGLQVELQLVADGTHVAAEMPSPPIATMLPPGTMVGVRTRRVRRYGSRM